MKKINCITLVICCICYLSVHSQKEYAMASATSLSSQPIPKSVRPSDISVIEGSNYNLEGLLRTDTYSGIETGMFLDNAWAEGELLLQDGSVLSDWKFRYNLRFQQMQYTNGTDTLALAIPSEVLKLNFDDHSFVYLDYQEQEDNGSSYFEVILDGKSQLLLRRIITHYLVKESYNQNENKYLYEEMYYIHHAGEKAARLCLNKKRVINCFPDKKAELQSYIKKNKLRMKCCMDLEKLVAYYNSLF